MSGYPPNKGSAFVAPAPIPVLTKKTPPQAGAPAASARLATERQASDTRPEPWKETLPIKQAASRYARGDDSHRISRDSSPPALRGMQRNPNEARSS